MGTTTRVLRSTLDDVQGAVSALLGVGHDMADERVVPWLGELQLDEAALRREETERLCSACAREQVVAPFPVDGVELAAHDVEGRADVGRRSGRRVLA